MIIKACYECEKVFGYPGDTPPMTYCSCGSWLRRVKLAKVSTPRPEYGELGEAALGLLKKGFPIECDFDYIKHAIEFPTYSC